MVREAPGALCKHSTPASRRVALQSRAMGFHLPPVLQQVADWVGVILPEGDAEDWWSHAEHARAVKAGLQALNSPLQQVQALIPQVFVGDTAIAAQQVVATFLSGPYSVDNRVDALGAAADYSESTGDNIRATEFDTAFMLTVALYQLVQAAITAWTNPIEAEVEAQVTRILTEEGIDRIETQASEKIAAEFEPVAEQISKLPGPRGIGSRLLTHGIARPSSR
jgi:hypothetical protein